MAVKASLVGYTGFVGSNLAACCPFDGLYNTKNIREAYGTRPELLVYAGIRAEKFLADRNPEGDFRAMEEAVGIVEKIDPGRLILISTVDVYGNPQGVDEREKPARAGLKPYGANRLWLEEAVRERWPDALILRLPALFGKNLKKNFIFDILHPVPSLLSGGKFRELSGDIPDLDNYYRQEENGFFRCIYPDKSREREALWQRFQEAGFCALQFTDSRSRFQFYSLKYLWGDILKALKMKIPLLNLAAEPIEAGELYTYLTGGCFTNYLPGMPVNYDFRSAYADAWGGKNGYLYPADRMREEIRSFVKEEQG